MVVVEGVALAVVAEEGEVDVRGEVREVEEVVLPTAPDIAPELTPSDANADAVFCPPVTALEEEAAPVGEAPTEGREEREGAASGVINCGHVAAINASIGFSWLK